MPADAPKSYPKGGFKLDRLTAISDGVIAIALTILVLGLEVPSVHEVPPSDLPEFLKRSMLPAAGFVTSFLLIGTYWFAHYAIFHYLRYATRMLVVLNGLFLLCVSFVAFPTGLQAVYRHDELAIVLYAAAQLTCGLTLLGIWWYAIRGHLVDPDISPAVLRSMAGRLSIVPILSLVAIGVSFVNIMASRLILATIPFFYISHRVVDTGWQIAQTDDLGQ